MLRLSEPHGGVLVDRFVGEAEACELRERARSLPTLVLDRRELSDLELVATGAASPLTGFLGLRDYQSVLARLRLGNGTPWPVPFTLAVALDRFASLLRERAAPRAGWATRPRSRPPHPDRCHPVRPAGSPRRAAR